MFGLFKSKKQDWRANVQPVGSEVEVKSGDNLLKAALEAGLAWPHDCRVGSCGTCRCTLKEGKIKPLSDFSYVLTGDELESGMILACQSALRSDILVEVQLNDEVQKVEVTSHQGKISSVRWLTHDIIELVIALGDAFQRTAIAGQYAEVQTPAIDKPRSYSFAKAPEDEAEGEVTFFVRRVPGGEFTEWLFAEDRTGASLTLTGPYGSFWLHPGDGTILCIAGGSGMSSIKAVLENARNKRVQRNVLYLFGARTQKDLYCLEEMDNLKRDWNQDVTFDFVPVLSEEPEGSGWQGGRGLVTDYLQKTYIDTGKIDMTTCQGYLCGPPPMIDAAIEVMNAAGLMNKHIFFDKFLDASTMPGGRK